MPERIEHALVREDAIAERNLHPGLGECVRHHADPPMSAAG
jgi:hypothetical protein